METKNIILMILYAIVILYNLFVNKSMVEGFQNVDMAQPTKCFSCERQLKSSNKYMGGPSKCFSCEKELAKNNGNSSLAQPTKCFSCEKQMLKK